MTTHKQVNVNGINVDEGLADLLSLLWEDGIETQFSCQGRPDEPAMIVFPSIEDGLRFMRGTLDIAGWYGCYTGRLQLQMAGTYPGFSGLIRSVVRWPSHVTPAWTAAWRGCPLALEDFFELCEPGFKAEQARLEAEEAAL